MKYTPEQKAILYEHQMLNFRPFQKEPKQQALQEMIDSHYPKKEKFEVYESKMNSNSGHFSI